ncbi:MAG: polyamine aminopropyltransferase [Oscillospiraceae bacterium]|nr:polyamine aminopropyltransferase [Oscillospiraceae bacterium]
MADYRYTEWETDRVSFSIEAERLLYSGQSDFQSVDVYESRDFGRFLVLDGWMMITERDEFIYHEMITHVPMAVNPAIKKILVIGGGDGGAVRELLRYPTVERVDLVEIDPKVVEVCREFFSAVSCGLDDPRVCVRHEDGVEYVRRYEGAYDLIIVDSTDPIGPGKVLFSKEFYESCHRALNESGILINQHENAFYKEEAGITREIHGHLYRLFPISKVYHLHIPSYPCGQLFGFASKRFHPVRDLDAARWDALGLQLKYYNTRLHKGVFALPSYVEALLREAEVE